MKNFGKIAALAALAALAATLVQTIQATPITGNIGFTGNAVFNTPYAGTATAVTSWNDTQVQSVSAGSSFALFITPELSAAFNNSVVWNFNDPGTPINNFWQAGGFTFELLSSQLVADSNPNPGFVFVQGAGIVSGNGFTPTAMNWSFSSQDPSIAGANGPDWTFSASAANVPEGGSTVTLLGLALSGAVFLRRRWTA